MSAYRLISIASFALLAIITTGARDLAAQGRTFSEPRTVADTYLTPFSGGVVVENTLYISDLCGRPDRDPRQSAG